MINQPHSLRKQVLEKIEQGSVRMRSRLYFTCRTIAVLAATAVVLSLSSFIFSFLLFSLFEGGERFLLGFGNRGIATFLVLFPWIPLMLDIVAILALRSLIGGFRSVYRLPFVIVLGLLMLTSVAFALLINLTPLHETLYERAQVDDLPLLGSFYKDIRTPREEYGEFRGVIETIDGRTITIMRDDNDDDTDDGIRIITVPDSVDISSFKRGDEIYVAGDDHDHDDVIEAYGASELHDFQEGEENEQAQHEEELGDEDN